MKILIISPHFPPTNAADMHRVRLVLPYLRENGLDVEVLAVTPETVASPQDLWMAAGLPDDVPIHRVPALGLKWSKVPGLGTLNFRALNRLKSEGNKLLRNKKYDLVYFSTTQFGVLALGPHWKKEFGVPFVVDYQDPWVSDYYRQHPEVTPPGGRLKYGIASWLARQTEPKVLRQCSGITSVSPAYPEQLRSRYRFLPADWPVLLAPFPGDALDLERVARDLSIKQTVFDSKAGFQNWVYVGVAGQVMNTALRAVFKAIQTRRTSDPEPWQNIRLHFVGTSYASAGTGTPSAAPLAAEYGLSDLVRESTDRIPYSETMRCLLDADALIVPGSNDPGYTASKIYPYLLAQKPLLGVFHEESSIVSLIESVGGGVVVPFQTDEEVSSIATRIEQRWLSELPAVPKVPLDKDAFQPYLAHTQAKQLAAFFESVLARCRQQCQLTNGKLKTSL